MDPPAAGSQGTKKILDKGAGRWQKITASSAPTGRTGGTGAGEK